MCFPRLVLPPPPADPLSHLGDLEASTGEGKFWLFSGNSPGLGGGRDVGEG